MDQGSQLQSTRESADRIKRSVHLRRGVAPFDRAHNALVEGGTSHLGDHGGPLQLESLIEAELLKVPECSFVLHAAGRHVVVQTEGSQ